MNKHPQISPIDADSKRDEGLALKPHTANGSFFRSAFIGVICGLFLCGCCSWEPAQQRRYRELRQEYQRTNQVPSSTFQIPGSEGTR